MKLTGRVEGLAALNARLAAIGGERAYAAELRAAAEDVRERAAATLAESGSSGALARSLTVAPAEGGYGVGTALDEGWHREFGSRNRPAAPWLAPAAEAARPGLLARLRERLGALLRRPR